MNRLLLSLFLLLAFIIAANAQTNVQFNRSLSNELLKLEKQDQKYREQLDEVEKLSLPADEKKKRTSALWQKQHKLDQKNVKRLVEIINKYGWPTRSLVGKEASVTAFLIIQHADLAHQKKYFPLLKAAVAAGEADPDDAALLEDRILMREGKNQIYGSQLRFNEKTQRLELWPIEDEKNVDARRATVGLEPLADYLKRFGLEYQPPSP